MTYATHRYLGTLLYPELRDRWDIALDEESFLYGCVKPDVTTLFVRHPHFWNISRRFALKRIARLCERKPKPAKAHRRFSEELGVALHYVADFFTAVHNLSPNPLRAHIEFERVLHEAFLTAVGQDSVAGHFNFRERLPGDTARDVSRSLAQELARRHARYAPDRSRPERDLHAIIGASVLVAAAVMDAVTLSAGAINSGVASPRPGLPRETPQGRDLQASVPDIADFR